MNSILNRGSAEKSRMEDYLTAKKAQQLSIEPCFNKAISKIEEYINIGYTNCYLENRKPISVEVMRRLVSRGFDVRVSVIGESPNVPYSGSWFFEIFWMETSGKIYFERLNDLKEISLEQYASMYGGSVDKNAETINREEDVAYVIDGLSESQIRDNVARHNGFVTENGGFAFYDFEKYIDALISIDKFKKVTYWPW